MCLPRSLYRCAYLSTYLPTKQPASPASHWDRVTVPAITTTSLLSHRNIQTINKTHSTQIHPHHQQKKHHHHQPSSKDPVQPLCAMCKARRRSQVKASSKKFSWKQPNFNSWHTKYFCFPWNSWDVYEFNLRQNLMYRAICWWVDGGGVGGKCKGFPMQPGRQRQHKNEKRKLIAAIIK